MKNLSLLVLMLAALVWGCEKEKAGPTGDGIQIRIENTSSHTYKDVVAKMDEDHSYGTLKSGEKSAYQEFSRAYRYAYVELKIDGQLYVLQPFDFVGEEELKDGKYTYQISAEKLSSQYGTLNLTFKED